MRDVLIFLLGSFAGKLIEDNLPSLHRSQWAKHTKKILHTLRALYAVVLILIALKFARSEQTKLYISMLLAALITTRLLANNKQKQLTI